MHGHFAELLVLLPHLQCELRGSVNYEEPFLLAHPASEVMPILGV